MICLILVTVAAVALLIMPDPAELIRDQMARYQTRYGLSSAELRRITATIRRSERMRRRYGINAYYKD